ncbi:hypothetical protein B0H19DRAFT_1380182 [Mycena capillaripes]|nr:hypothetical protein B0H19DRAFT_1380182 [Mycena capillaripes]
MLPPLRCLALKAYISVSLATQMHPIEVYFQRAGRELETLLLAFWSPRRVPAEYSQFGRRLLVCVSNVQFVKFSTPLKASVVPDT